LVGCSINQLKKFKCGLDNDNKKDGGRYWYNWVLCRERTNSFKKCSVSEKPELLTTLQWKSWKDNNIRTKRDGKVLISRHHLAIRLQYPNVVLPKKLGGKNGGVSHLCDNTKCFRKNHVDYNINQQFNIDRKSCMGMELLISNNIIVQAKPCQHTTNGGLCCRRIKVNILNQKVIAAIIASNTEQESSDDDDDDDDDDDFISSVKKNESLSSNTTTTTTTTSSTKRKSS
jgi:hypothetical protein